MKCLRKYKWVKLPRMYLPAGKGLMGYWAKLASRAAFRKGNAVYCGHTNPVTPGMWSGGVVGLKSILGVKKRAQALGIMEQLQELGYQQIADDMGMETSEVRAIAAKALRKLRAPDFYNLIRFGLKDTVGQMIRMESECGFQDGFNRGIDDRNQGDGEAVLPDDVMEKLRMIPIDNLELSYKTCFRLH